VFAPRPASGPAVAHPKHQRAKRINVRCSPAGAPPWQRNCHEHTARNARQPDRLWRYVAQNPARWRSDGESPLRMGMKAGKGA